MSQPPNYPNPGGDQPPAAPQYGAPQYGAPQYGAPQYGAPQYPNQPQYPSQPQYPAGEPQYPGQVLPPQPPTAQPPKKGKALKIVLIVLAVLLVLCAGGAAAVYFLVRDEVATATDTRVTAPETLAGKPKVTQPELAAATAQMEAELRSALPQATSTVSAFYGDLLAQDLVMVVAASGPVVDPEKEVNDALASAGLGVTNIKDVDAGPMGGTAKCGDGAASGVNVGVCSWADRGSLGVIVVFGKTGAEAAADFVDMRGAIEQQG